MHSPLQQRTRGQNKSLRAVARLATQFPSIVTAQSDSGIRASDGQNDSSMPAMLSLVPILLAVYQGLAGRVAEGSLWAGLCLVGVLCHVAASVCTNSPQASFWLLGAVAEDHSTIGHGSCRLPDLRVLCGCSGIQWIWDLTVHWFGQGPQLYPPLPQKLRCYRNRFPVSCSQTQSVCWHPGKGFKANMAQHKSSINA